MSPPPQSSMAAAPVVTAAPTSYRRKPFVGGNWKSNGTNQSVTELINALCLVAKNKKDSINSSLVDVVLAPTFLHIGLAESLLSKEGSSHQLFQLSTQNVSKYGSGAFTGEIAAEMITNIGLQWAIIGHSERRHKFGESCDDTAKKVGLCQAVNLQVIFCIGELLEERKAGKTLDVCRAQIEAIIPQVKDWSKIVIAYEPVWAIGTGQVATSQQAQEAHASVRSVIAEKVGKSQAGSLRIIYGGSVTPENARELMTMQDVDGFLVGGASLKPSFMDIVISAVEVDKTKH